ncbi:MAG: HAMP domain-containing sensor histidine kinase [bacterium]
MIKIFSRSYYRNRIIISFGLISVLLVAAISYLGYSYLKELYLEQISGHVKNILTINAKLIDKAYIDILELGKPTGAVERYYRERFDKIRSYDPGIKLMLFDDEFKIIIDADSVFKYGDLENRLVLNRKEILELRQQNSFTSQPFKTEDNEWFMWGFYRISRKYFIALRENAAVLGKIDEYGNDFILVGFGGILLSLVMAIYLAGSILRPVNKLIDFSGEIGKGNFSIDSPLGMKGELNLLSDAMLKMKNDLEDDHKERNKLLAQIAHEIRNPLGSIELLANLVKEDLNKKEFDTEYIQKILLEINGLKQLISSYLEYSKPMPPTPESLDLHLLISDIGEKFHTMFESNKIDFKYSVEDKEIVFDKNHLNQILMNLILNSIDAIGANGTISVKLSNENGIKKITIEDTGKGIPPENLKKVLEPFFTTKKNGTGLGLSICKKLAKENGADITVESKPGEGTKFILSIWKRDEV